MTNILLVASSAAGEGSVSRRIGLGLIDAVGRTCPDVKVVERNLLGVPHLELETLRALRIPPEDRTAAQAAAVRYADGFVEEVEQAELIVIGAPMYCHTIPSTLKVWIEYLNRPGRTMRKTEGGSEGLLRGKRVCVIVTRSSVFEEGDPASFQDPYLTYILGTFGLTDIEFIRAEDTAHPGGPAQIEDALGEAAAFGAVLGREFAQRSVNA